MGEGGTGTCFTTKKKRQKSIIYCKKERYNELTASCQEQSFSMILLCYWEMSFYAFGCHGIVNITVAMSLGGALMVSPQRLFIAGDAVMVSCAEVRIVQHCQTWNGSSLVLLCLNPVAFRTSQRKTCFVGWVSDSLTWFWTVDGRQLFCPGPKNISVFTLLQSASHQNHIGKVTLRAPWMLR